MIGGFINFIFEAIFVTFVWLITHLAILVTILGLAAMWLAWFNVRRLKASGMFLFQRGTDKIVFRKCKDCDGCGVTLVGGHIIPKQYRTFENEADGLVFRGPIANTVRCDVCNGMGGLWVGKNAERRNNISDRRIGDRWS